MIMRRSMADHSFSPTQTSSPLVLFLDAFFARLEMQPIVALVARRAARRSSTSAWDDGRLPGPVAVTMIGMVSWSTAREHTINRGTEASGGGEPSPANQRHSLHQSQLQTIELTRANQRRSSRRSKLPTIELSPANQRHSASCGHLITWPLLQWTTQTPRQRLLHQRLIGGILRKLMRCVSS